MGHKFMPACWVISYEIVKDERFPSTEQTTNHKVKIQTTLNFESLVRAGLNLNLRMNLNLKR